MGRRATIPSVSDRRRGSPLAHLSVSAARNLPNSEGDPPEHHPAEIGKFLLHFGIGERVVDPVVQHTDDFRRRAFRPVEPIKGRACFPQTRSAYVSTDFVCSVTHGTALAVAPNVYVNVKENLPNAGSSYGEPRAEAAAKLMPQNMVGRDAREYARDASDPRGR